MQIWPHAGLGAAGLLVALETQDPQGLALCRGVRLEGRTWHAEAGARLLPPALFIDARSPSVTGHARNVAQTMTGHARNVAQTMTGHARNVAQTMTGHARNVAQPMAGHTQSERSLFTACFRENK
ncbi:MAG: hypothetical protein EBR09_16435 [Proteobacteria bacterium]|nr:hypothetical protein [Pseudomonadota bacterium]